ncbi:MAG: hypothetical protein KO202_04025 [Methanobacteriaceae archaeon]|jgi:hypothetical protein|nr:hypothetical protein [Methanobacteriaceae archaeon]
MILIILGIFISISTISAAENVSDDNTNFNVEENDINKVSYEYINSNQEITDYENTNHEKNKESTLISKNETTIHYNEKEKFNVKLFDSYNKPLSNKDIIFSINDVNYTRLTDENGVAGLTINLLEGNYLIKYSFKGDDNYSSFENECLLNVVKKEMNLTGEDLTMNYGSGKAYEVLLTDSNNKVIKNENIIFNINGIDYLRKTNENGLALITINLYQGIYQVSYKLDSNSKYKSNQYSRTIYVHGQPYLYASDLNIAYGLKESFKVMYYDSLNRPIAGKNISIEINGRTYIIVTDENGSAKLNINLNPNLYTVKYSIDNLSGLNNINIKDSMLIGNNMEMIHGNQNYYSVTLKDNNGNIVSGKNIIFTINGVNYTKTTDKDGIARIKINLNPDEYIVNTRYNGEADLSSASLTNIIKVMALSKILLMDNYLFCLFCSYIT